jgi:hypothetical protein
MRLKVSVFSIATNVYFDYWLSLYNSANKNLFPDADVTYHVFTNIVPDEATQKLFKKNVVMHKVADLRWPDATLMRYELIVNEMCGVGADVLVYLDADMKIECKIDLGSIFDINKDKMVLVRHPGFWRPSILNNRTFYFRHFRLLLDDLALKFRIGGIGSWELDERSTAFVPKKDRKFYYCGGFWLGKRESVIEFSQTMYTNVRLDANINFTAVWHDESHLNRWASENSFREHDPSYCFAENYENLERLTKKITAVNKSLH